jgi:hypothetical protein
MSEVQISVVKAQETQIVTAVPGIQGPVGPGVPSGGTTNQVLFKASADNYDTAWSEVTSAMIGDLEIVNADVATNAAIALSKLATGALPSGITVASSNIVDGTIVDADVNASAAIALSKLATGALPSGITVASTNIVDGTIVDADVNASAAIAGTKIAPNFGSQTITTTGVISPALGTAAAPSIAFTGDLNTGIYSPGADQVAVATNGSGRLFINSTGLVGVGTANPSANGLVTIAETTNARLYLTDSTLGNTYGGQLRGFGVAGQGGHVELGVVDNNVYAKAITVTAQANNIIFSRGATERMRITSAGLVGIGTSSPGDIVHINKASTTATVAYLSNTGGEARIGVENNSGTGVLSGAGAYDTVIRTAASTGISFGIGYTAPAVRIDSSGRLGIGTTSPGFVVHANRSTAVDTFYGSQNSVALSLFGTDSAGATAVYNGSAYPIQFSTNGTERARIDSSGRLLVGTSSAFGVNYLQIQGDSGGATGTGGISLRRNVAPSGMADGAFEGIIDFGPNDGGVGARIAAIADAQQGTNDYPSRLVFSTTAAGASSPTERMRIDRTGDTFIGKTSLSGDVTTIGCIFRPLGKVILTSGTGAGAQSLVLAKAGASGTETLAEFYYNGGSKGSITSNGTNTAYNTSSDYRLKENVTSVSDGITRLQQLKPSRFNFIADPDKTVDGFLAHEVQDIVPEAITGEKDAVDDDGNPVYQGIDQSKLVPLLTAALQEAIGRIETLEAEVAALKA